MKRKLFFAAGLIANIALAQTYDNGPLTTGTTTKSGVTAPAGYTWSEVQNNTGNMTESNTNSGYSGTWNSSTAFFFLADDFTIPAGAKWQISSIDFFAYQTGYTGATNPFTTVRVNILNADPSGAGAVSVFGDDTTNRYASGTDANMYRIFNSLYPTPTAAGTTRKIWKVKANTSVTLDPGTYWIKYQLQNATAASAGFLPSVTLPGTRGLSTFNAKQYNNSVGTWIDLIDSGNPDAAPDYTADMPFVITFTNLLATGETMQYDNRIQVYPNPVKESFKISNPGKINISSVEITDSSGKLVKTMKGADDYNISELPKGIYFLKIKSNETSKITKLIKQ
jgi:hypothetical protein